MNVMETKIATFRTLSEAEQYFQQFEYDENWFSYPPIARYYRTENGFQLDYYEVQVTYIGDGQW